MISALVWAFLVIFAIQICFFLLASLFRTDKFTDISYGLTFVFITLLYYFSKSTKEIIPLLVTVLITVWGVRLAGYLFVRIIKTKKDERFDKIRNDVFKFGIFWLFQAITIWIILIPAILVLNLKNASGFGPISAIGLIIWIVGFSIESIADQQKFIFKSLPENKNKWLSTGIWKYSRHPNYFGEILVWIGIFVICLPYLSGVYYLSIISPIFIAFILLFISGTPTLEKRYNEKFIDDKDYQLYKKQTPVLVPFINF